MTRTQERISDVISLVTGALLIAMLALTARALIAPAPRVPYAAAVMLEGVVVTPKRVYSYTHWALSRPVPQRVVSVRPPQRLPQQC